MAVDYKANHNSIYRKLRESDATAFIAEGVEARVTWFLSNFGAAKGRVLVLGCGNGLVSKRVAQSGFDVVGVDISPEAISWANEGIGKSASVSFVLGDVLDLPFSDNEFDFVIDDYCFHCIIGIDRSTILNEVKRVLKTCGLFVSITMSGEPAQHDVIFEPNGRVYLNSKGIPFRYLGYPDSILEEVRSGGFTIVSNSLNPRRSASEWDALHFVARK